MESITPTSIRFENIEKRYGGLYALRRINFEIAAGECVVLSGHNGSGKTTLLRIAAGLAGPSSGKTTFFSGGNAIVKARCGFVGHAIMVYDELTAEENLLLFAKLQGVAAPRERVAELLAEVGLAERSKSLVRTFSRGMRQRMAIARALLQRPSVFLLDEPSTGLDVSGSAWLARTLRDLRDRGATMLMSLHGDSEVAALATRTIGLKAGTVESDERHVAAASFSVPVPAAR